MTVIFSDNFVASEHMPMEIHDGWGCAVQSKESVGVVKELLVFASRQPGYAVRDQSDPMDRPLNYGHNGGGINPYEEVKAEDVFLTDVIILFGYEWAIRSAGPQIGWKDVPNSISFSLELIPGQKNYAAQIGSYILRAGDLVKVKERSDSTRPASPA